MNNGVIFLIGALSLITHATCSKLRIKDSTKSIHRVILFDCLFNSSFFDDYYYFESNIEMNTTTITSENSMPSEQSGSDTPCEPTYVDTSSMSTSTSVRFRMPAEEDPHEGTWLQWPHNYGWDPRHVERYESSWVEMARALHTDEIVHVIVYDDDGVQKARVETLLASEGLDMSRVDFVEIKTNDVWVRDNGPVFVVEEEGVWTSHRRLVITDWVFNGWGGKHDWELDDAVPSAISAEKCIPLVSTPGRMINEGGSIEVDGRGTLMAKRSSILNNNRNPGMTQEEAEAIFTQYLGVTNFIWLDGIKGLDVTDDHIDGTARFANGDTIVTMQRGDFLPRQKREYDVLASAVDTKGVPYKLVHLPLTRRKVPGTNDVGTYINYYVGNGVVLVPQYNGDPSDAKATSILQELYPSRKVVGIEAAELAKDGGMVHCVTQQQPAL